MIQTVKEVLQYRTMIQTLVHRDLRGRYKASFLGFMWTFIVPLCQLLVYTLVFSVILKSQIEKYYLYLFVGLIPWNFFSNCLTGGASCVIQQQMLVNKIYFPREVIPISYVSDPLQMVQLYNAVDAYVTPSLQDNLPNTIMEALACGTPCVGFRVGGIPEMIDHKENGYVARYRDAQDLAEGIEYCLGHDLREAAARKAAAAYGERQVARQYIALYED